MYNTYHIIAKALVKQAMLLMASKLGLTFLGGPIGTIIGFFVSPVLGFMILEGMLTAEFKKIEFQTKWEEKQYKDAIDKVNNYKGKMTPEMKAEFLKEIQDATRRFISIRQYLNKQK